jgi:hypothetical protein
MFTGKMAITRFSGERDSSIISGESACRRLPTLAVRARNATPMPDGRRKTAIDNMPAG